MRVCPNSQMLALKSPSKMRPVANRRTNGIVCTNCEEPCLERYGRCQNTTVTVAFVLLHVGFLVLLPYCDGRKAAECQLTCTAVASVELVPFCGHNISDAFYQRLLLTKRTRPLVAPLDSCSVSPPATFLHADSSRCSLDAF